MESSSKIAVFAPEQVDLEQLSNMCNEVRLIKELRCGHIGFRMSVAKDSHSKKTNYDKLNAICFLSVLLDTLCGWLTPQTCDTFVQQLGSAHRLEVW